MMLSEAGRSGYTEYNASSQFAQAVWKIKSAYIFWDGACSLPAFVSKYSLERHEFAFYMLSLKSKAIQ